MKNKLTVTMQGIQGGKNKNEDKGYCLLTAYNKGVIQCQISVDTFEGSGKDYKEREQPQIEIYFPSINGEKRFIGTADQLSKILFPYL